MINIALWNPSLGGGTPLLKRSKVRVGCSGASDGAIGFILAFFALSVFGATNGANAGFGPGFGPSCFANAACFATGAASTLGVSRPFGESLTCSALRGITLRVFCLSSGA